MPKFRVSVPISGEATCEVEAESEQDAYDKADDFSLDSWEPEVGMSINDADITKLEDEENDE